MKRKILAILFIFATCALPAFAIEKVKIGDLYYNLNPDDRTAEVTSQNSSYPYWTTDITTANIPISIEYHSTTYRVTNIEEHAFDGCESLTSITIPNSVTHIGDRAFYGCQSLISVSIPNSVTHIGDRAFYGCKSLISMSIPNSVTHIGDWVFSDCKSLISVSIPNSVTSIGAGAFCDCESLTSVTIPNSVTSINGTTPFYGCRNLHTINVANDNPNYSSIDGVLFNKSKTKLLRCPIGKQGTYSIPRGVISIEPCAFEDCKGLISVSIPNSVTCIGKSAFSSCKGLTSVTIPNSVTRIGNDAFSNCINLISPVYNTHCFIRLPKSYCGTYTIPNGIRTISGSAFARCDSLISIEIPNSVTNIGDYAFSSCHGLTSVKIPNSVTSIGDDAFFGCISLTTITIPNSVTSIGEHAFLSCNNILSPVYNSHVFAYMPRSYNGAYTIPNGIESIAAGAFYGCKSLTSVLIPRSVTKIAKDAFPFCVNLYAINVVYDNPNYTSISGVLFDKSKTKLVRCPPGIQGRYLIPYGIISIGCYAFHMCHGLTSVTIPNSVTKIETWAFAHCSGLTSIEIPFNVTNIEKEAFWGDNIKEFYYPQGLDLSQAGILSTVKLIASNPSNSYTSTTASSRSTSDTNSATTPRTASSSTTSQSTTHTPNTYTKPTTPTSRPICTILSPKEGDPYSTPTIRLEYKIENLSEMESVKFYVNGVERKPKNNGGSNKGVKLVNRTVVELEMPTENGKDASISIVVVDANNDERIVGRRKLKYVSEHKPTLHVFAVGVNKYKAKGFVELRYAEKDACDFSKTIIDIADKNMYERVDTTVILGSQTNRNYILAQLMKLEGRVKSNDIVMLFFSGHGKVENGKSYFITSDAEYVIQGLATRDIVDQIELMKKRSNVFVFMDACHSGATKTTERTKGNAKPITLAESEVIGYYSCAEKQESIEDENLKNGVFTYALVKGLKGTDANEEQITIHELAEYIRKWVREKTNGRQSPTLDYQGDDYVIFYKKK